MCDSFLISGVYFGVNTLCLTPLFILWTCAWNLSPRAPLDKSLHVITGLDYQRKHVRHFWPWQILTTSPYTRELKQQQRRRLRKRQIIKKWIRAASNFIGLILSRSIRQMLVIFSGVEFFKTVLKFRKRKRKSLSFTSSTKHEIRHFHVPS